MIDHLTLTVSNLERSKSFYRAALAPLGYGIKMDFGEVVGFGDHKPYFWLKQGTAHAPMHLAFVAKNRAAVDAFHAAAIAAGARDNGSPGLRPDYHPNYYGAFVLELDGHPIEAVFHGVPAASGKPAKKTARKPAAKKKARRAVRKRR